jgi:hypothetical protein
MSYYNSLKLIKNEDTGNKLAKTERNGELNLRDT